MEGNAGIKTKNIYPTQKASCFSKIFFWWAIPFFYKRYKNEHADVFYKPLKSHDSKRLGNMLQKAWEHETTRPKPSLCKALWKTLGLQLVAQMFIFLFLEITKISQPYLIGKLIGQYTKSSKSKNEIYIYGSLLLLTNFLYALLAHSYMLNIQHLGMKARVACCSLIYRKALKLNASSLMLHSSGKIVNLVTSDVNRFDMAPMYLFQLVAAPLETIFVVTWLYFIVGSTSILGIVFLVLFVPIQLLMGKLASSFRAKTAPRTDQRVQLSNEIISGIKAIKMFAWEQHFVKMIEAARKFEIKQIKSSANLKALNTSYMMFIHRIGVALCIITYVLVEGRLDAETVFTLMAIFAVLKNALTVYFPLAVNNFMETRISIERIREFLLSPEVLELEMSSEKNERDKLLNSTPLPISRKQGKREGVNLERVSIKRENFLLQGVNFNALPKELIAVIGPVGSGKSSILLTILGELAISGGIIELKGSLSYASQEPWLFSGTIRQNIVFGGRFDPVKFNKVLDMCQLKKDLIDLPQRDETQVGEKGAALSGGQKARINLARALYKDADIYLLDDIFSAVDVHVGRNIFQECILKYLRNKCVVFVTHHLEYIGNANRIYMVAEGTTKICDHFDKIDLPRHQEQERKEAARKKAPQESVKEAGMKQTGSISKHVYQKYCTAGGNKCVFFFLCLCFILTQVGISAFDYFVTFWLNLNGTTEFFTLETCIYIYAAIMLFCIVVTTVRSLLFFRFCINAAANLHTTMIQTVIRGPMTFFDSNTSGQILNRFSKDLGILDEVLPTVMVETFQIGFIVLGSTLLIIYLNPWITFPTVAMFVLFYFFRIVFLTTSRNLKRLEATSRSPVFLHINTSLQGLPTIRSFNVEATLQNEFDHHQDLHTSAYYMFLTCNRAFGFWLDLLCVLYVAIVFAAIILNDMTQAGNIGLAVIQSMNLIGVIQWGLRQWSEMENQMTSVERVVEFSQLAGEPNVDIIEIPDNWPIKGDIRFQSVSLSYQGNGCSVLDDITLRFQAGEKIGIVGRTGAGKSSIISALFRLYDFQGAITIDDVDIKSIALEKLRTRITLIPQEPTLFSGRLRDNLDPFREFDDFKLWAVLEQVELKKAVLNIPEGLCHVISPNGAGFSAGQRQLVCLARAILRGNKIIVLDEATASVDTVTDEAIQRTIAMCFKECTVLTVAHKLDTVMVSDKVLVMDAGKAVEFEHPHILLQNYESLFYGLVMESGATISEKLTKMAQENYLSTK